MWKIACNRRVALSRKRGAPGNSRGANACTFGFRAGILPRALVMMQVTLQQDDNESPARTSHSKSGDTSGPIKAVVKRIFVGAKPCWTSKANGDLSSHRQGHTLVHRHLPKIGRLTRTLAVIPALPPAFLVPSASL